MAYLVGADFAWSGLVDFVRLCSGLVGVFGVGLGLCFIWSGRILRGRGWSILFGFVQVWSGLVGCPVAGARRHHGVGRTGAGMTEALVAVGAALGFFAVFGEDDAGFLAAVDLGLSGELAAEQVNGAAILAEGGGQAEDVDEQAAVELRAG